MRIALIGAYVVQVVREDQREAYLRREAEELLVETTLFWEAVILHLEEEATLAKDFAVFTSEGTCMLPIINLKCAGDLTIQAPREANEPLCMSCQMLVIGTWLVVETVEVCIGHDPAEIAIARAACREGNQVEWLLVGLPLLIAHAAPCDVGFNANDRLNPMPLCGLHELNRSVEGTVIGERNGVHSQALRLRHERIQVAHAVEQAEFAMDVEMREISLGAHVGQSSDRRTIPLWMSRNAHGYGQPLRPPKGAPLPPPRRTRSCAAC